jgi:hypothetical protein
MDVAVRALLERMTSLAWGVIALCRFALIIAALVGSAMPRELIGRLALAIAVLIALPFVLAALDAASTGALAGGLVVLMTIVLGLAWRIARLQRRREGAAHRWIRAIPAPWRKG